MDQARYLGNIDHFRLQKSCMFSEISVWEIWKGQAWNPNPPTNGKRQKMASSVFASLALPQTSAPCYSTHTNSYIMTKLESIELFVRFSLNSYISDRMENSICTFSTNRLSLTLCEDNSYGEIERRFPVARSISSISPTDIPVPSYGSGVCFIVLTLKISEPLVENSPVSMRLHCLMCISSLVRDLKWILFH